MSRFIVAQSIGIVLPQLPENLEKSKCHTTNWLTEIEPESSFKCVKKVSTVCSNKIWARACS
jgi:hypothetical protein